MEPIQTWFEHSLNLDKEITVWKGQMEKKCKQVRLVSEVIASQNGSSEESDSMDLSSVDFSLKTVEKCKHFDAET